MERLTVLYFFIATSLATEISDFDSICSHLVEKQGTSGNSLCRCNDATCHCDTDGHVSRIDPCWAVAYLSDTQRNNVSMTSRQSEGEIYSPVTYALIGHNRLLGFIAKNDEPLRHLKFTPSDPSALATTFSLYDASATGKRGMPTVLDYQMPGDFVTLRRDYTKIYFITHGVRESISHHDYKELSDLLIQHDRGCAVVHVNWNRGASINTFQAANYGFSLDDVTAVSNLVYGLPAVNAMVVGRELALVSYLLTSYNVVSRDRIHYIGYDIGAHVMHFAGQYYQILADRDIDVHGGFRGRAKIGRITGLDPLARNFQGFGEATTRPYLNFNDADFVDIIHTSVVSYDGTGSDIVKNRLGMSVATGHVDFYPNGGDKQPSCTTLFRTQNDCNHRRALFYFMASLKNETEININLRSQYADSYEDFKRKSDSTSSKDASDTSNFMGINARNLKGQRVFQDTQFLKFGLDEDQKFIATPSRRFWQKIKKPKLIDTLSPNSSTAADGYDFSKFPSHDLSSIPVEPRDPQDMPGCGRFLAPSDTSGRIHLGLSTYVRQFPWNVCLVALRSRGYRDEYYVACSGVLITDEFVATAAHCFLDYSETKTEKLVLSKDRPQLYLMFGRDCLRPIVKREIVIVQDVTVFIHPEYRQTAGQYSDQFDMALIKLLKPLDGELLPVDGIFTNKTKINPVCWKKARQYAYNDLNEVIYVAANGMNMEHEDGYSKMVQWSVFKLEPSMTARLPHNFFAVNAETAAVRNTCGGDSGAPFFRYLRHEDDTSKGDSRLSPYTAHLVGTLIGGSIPVCGSKNDISFVSKFGFNGYYDWVEEVISRNGRITTGMVTLAKGPKNPVNIESFLIKY